MSYDPYADGSDMPPLADAASARQRVQAPGIALIVVGVLNLLMALVQVGGTVYIAVMPASNTMATYQKLEDMGGLPKGFVKKMEEEQQKQGQTPESMKTNAIIQNALGTLLMLAVAILSLLGGIRMRALRSYGLSITGAVSAAIPCISCGGCCLFGEAIGIWALVVLLNADVKSAFR